MENRVVPFIIEDLKYHFPSITDTSSIEGTLMPVVSTMDVIKDSKNTSVFL